MISSLGCVGFALEGGISGWRASRPRVFIFLPIWSLIFEVGKQNLLPLVVYLWFIAYNLFLLFQLLKIMIFLHKWVLLHLILWSMIWVSVWCNWLLIYPPMMSLSCSTYPIFGLKLHICAWVQLLVWEAQNLPQSARAWIVSTRAKFPAASNFSVLFWLVPRCPFGLQLFVSS